MAVALAAISLPSVIRASSVDLHNRLPYNPHRSYPKKSSDISTVEPTVSLDKPKVSVSDLLKREIPQLPKKAEPVGTYLGYDTWLPSPQKVDKPRSLFNPASLAYIGDCIYELYARRHFLYPPINIEEYNDRVTAVVRCEAQDAMLRKLVSDNALSQEESGCTEQACDGRDVLRWGKNVGSAKTRTKKRAGVAVYNRASSLETLVGYLYLTNVHRLDEIMQTLGFSADSSNLLEQEK